MPKTSSKRNMPKKPEYKLVQLNMRLESLEKIEKLKKYLNTENRTDIVKTSIGVMAYISKAVKEEGSSILIEDKKGQRQKLIIPDLC